MKEEKPEQKAAKSAKKEGVRVFALFAIFCSNSSSLSFFLFSLSFFVLPTFRVFVIPSFFLASLCLCVSVVQFLLTSVQIPLCQIPISINPPIAQKRPVGAHHIHFVKLAFDQQRLFAVVAGFGQDVAVGIADK